MIFRALGPGGLPLRHMVHSFTSLVVLVDIARN